MPRLLHDLVNAWRSLRRGRGFVVGVLALLALGIGIATGAFAVLRGVLLRPLPYPAPERLVIVWQTDADDGSFAERASGPDFADYRARARSFDRLAAASFPEVNLRPAAGPPERVPAGAVTASFLPTLGARPLHGRLLSPADDVAGGPRVAVLWHELWQRAFGGDPGVVGRTILLDAQPTEVVGVLPAGFGFDEAELWLPLSSSTPFLDVRGVHNLLVLARLREGVSLEAAQAEMSGVMAALEKQYPDDNAGRGARVQPLHEAVVGDVRRELTLLSGAVALVLAIVCANVAGMWLLRAHARRGELAVRVALGASRARLVRQLLAEALLVAGGSAVLGIAVARLAIHGFLALRPSELPRAGELGLDPATIAFAVALALLAGALCGVVPLLAGGVGFTALRTRGGASGATRGARAALVVGEIAVALVLLSGTALLGRSVWNLLQVDPGFVPGRTMTFSVQLPEGRYPMPERSVYPAWPELTGAYQRLAERVRALPGVTGVALAANHPLQRGFTSQVTVVGRPEPEGSIEETRVHAVSAGYHGLLRVPLLAGRHLTATDGPDAPPVVVVNQAFARKHFAGASPLGERVNLWGRDLEIVGVVGDVRFQGLDVASAPAVHPPLPQLPFSDFRLLVSAGVAPAALERAVRGAVAELEPDVALHEVAPLDELLVRSSGERRFVMVLLATFGALAAALAAVGLYGVMAFQAAQRRRELGVRHALGAGRRDLVRLLAGEGARLTVAGALLGLAGSIALTRSLGAFLFEVAPLDPLALAAAVALLVALSSVAAWLPARRASRVDPMEVLREESA